jgi:hypothetical protein
MTEKLKSRRFGDSPALTLVAPSAEAVQVPAAPEIMGLRRAAEMVERVAFDLAGRESPQVVSRLIEIAAELERFSTRRNGTGARKIRLD